MRHLFVTVGLLLVVLCGMQAQDRPQLVPAAPWPMEHVQPTTGEVLHFYLRGDERGHFRMTLDGYLLMQNQDKVLCYAVMQKDGTIIASKRVAHDEENRKSCEKRWLKRKGINKMKS